MRARTRLSDFWSVSMTRFKQLSLSLCFICLSFSVWSDDLPVYERASLEQAKALEDGVYRIITSMPKRISNAIRIEQQERVEGAGSTQLFKLPAGTDIQAVYKFYTDFFNQQGNLVYKCEQRNCGNSSFWANEEFGERRLYGRDSDQYYLVGNLDLGKEKRWSQVYIVQNGRKDHYAFVRSIVTNEELGANDWIEGFTLDKPSLPPAVVKALNNALLEKKTKRLWIVSANRYESGETVEQSRVRAREAAENFKAALLKQLEVDPERIGIEARGNLAQRPASVSGSSWYVLYLR